MILNQKKALLIGIILIILCAGATLSIYLFKGITSTSKSPQKSAIENEADKENQTQSKSITAVPDLQSNAIPKEYNRQLDKNITIGIKRSDKKTKPRKNGLPILVYHAVDNNVFGEKEMFVSTASFEEQMKYLFDNGFTTLDLTEIKNFQKFKKPVVITFDDGYMDNYTNAYPILKKYKLKATIFLATGFINSPSYLTNDQIKQMSDQISFQSHSVSHPKLVKESGEQLDKECSESKSYIEKLTGKPVTSFAYPFGLYNKAVTQVVSKYYSYAVTTNFGYYNIGDNALTIKRVGVSYLYKLKDFTGLLE